MLASRPAAYAVLAFFLALTSLLYLPGLWGGFVFDDFGNILKNEVLNHVKGWDAQAITDVMWSSNSSVFKRPLSMLSFALNAAASGGIDPFALKLTNLVIHLLTGLGLFVFARALLNSHFLRDPDAAIPAPRAIWVAVLATVLWLTHPLQLTSILYVVQRMASLAALWMAWGLAAYCTGRVRQMRGQGGGAWIGVAYFVCLPLAFLSKDNGILLAPLLGLVEILFFRFAGPGRTRKALGLLHGVFVALPAALAVVLFAVFGSDWLNYAGRDFTLGDRLLTQARVLWFYLGLLLFPDIQQMGLYHDDFALSRALWSPPSTLLAWIAWIAVVAAALRYRRHAPMFAFAVGFFLIGHSMESTLLPLEMVHEHRNYLPSFGVFLAFSSLVYRGWRRWPRLRRIIVLALLGGIALNASLTALRASDWGDPLRLAETEARNHPHSPRALHDKAGALLKAALVLPPLGAEPLRTQLLQESEKAYRQAAEIDHYGLLGRIGALYTGNLLGIVPETAEVDALRVRLSTPPLAAATAEGLISLFSCEASGICHFDMALLLSLAEALEHNPQFDPISLIRLKTTIADLFLNKGDVGTAAAFLQETVRLQPDNPQARLNFAGALISAGEFEGAKMHIDAIRRLPLDTLHAIRLKELEDRLAQEQSASAEKSEELKKVKKN